MRDEARGQADAEPHCNDPDAEWIVTEGRRQTGLSEVLAGLCRHLVETGVPLARVMLSQRTLHPLVAARGIFWRQGNAGCTEQIDRGHDVLQDAVYLKSPLRLAYEQGRSVRRRLVGPGAELDFPVLEELRAEGMTDYLTLPMPFTNRIGGVLTLATTRPEGFSDADVARLSALIPVLALLVEVHATRDVARTVLETYVGGAAGQRVLSGQIGAPDRLDFTVIGPAVNRVVRIEEMCRKLDCGLLVSAEVARHCREKLESIGRHDLRGVGEKIELFTLPDLLRRTAAAAE